ncbi:ABC transporter [Actinoplanes sp. SE50]|uniref:ABC transporter ATP-binding protein n=1 Tax=unclassified Actinoplanes TaxID=2626549 RepID=UPI00023ED6FF|nr:MULTISPECIES: ABC transporter ATP-binding protein [unclassified Actinoplanes]AEV81221.1 Ribose import ATP-binding protein rbsA [Actinoplanes sp. SE50/110]ATO79624.1 ABC transporter [Actinoplanes sp. SE50]SLL97027.1 ABC transporter [Actinoplanes sp. SE50/110]
MSDVLAVDAVDLTKTYGALTAVDRLNLQVSQGEVYGVLGPNGAGKTTFLRMLFGLIRPDSGTLRVLGRTWTADGVRALDGVAGFIESPKFYPGLSGRKNLQLLAGLDGGTSRMKIDEVLETVDLRDRQRDKVAGYSFGMRQRLGVAASLLREPKLLVLDEPANGLDPAGIRDMRALVKRLAASGLTVLLSSHDMGEVEEICDDVTIMRTGTVVYHGSIAALRQRAPEQAHTMQTTDDDRAAQLATARGLDVSRNADGLAVRGPQPEIDALVAEIITDGIALRELARRETPLEALFFMLTEPDTDTPAPELATTGARR